MSLQKFFGQAAVPVLHAQFGSASLRSSLAPNWQWSGPRPQTPGRSVTATTIGRQTPCEKCERNRRQRHLRWAEADALIWCKPLKWRQV